MDKLSELEEKIKKNPNSKDFYTLASEYKKLGRLEESKKLCLTGLSNFPGNFQARLLLTQIYVAEGKFKEAKEQVGRVLVVVPDNITANHLAAEISEALGQKEDALRFYKVVELFEPGRAGVKEKIEELERKDSNNDGKIEIPPEKEGVITEEKENSSLEELSEEPKEFNKSDSLKEEENVIEDTLEEESEAVFEEPQVPKEEENIIEEIEEEKIEDVPLQNEIFEEEESEIKEEIGEDTLTELLNIEEEGIEETFREENNDLKSEEKTLAEDAIEEQNFEENGKIEENNLSSLSSATLADLYEQQGYPEKAVEILEHLLLKEPERDDLKSKIELLKRRMLGMSVESDVGGVDIKSALRLKRIETLKIWLKKIREA